MIQKLNKTAILSYSEKFSQIFCDSFFVKEDFISGEQILSLTNIRQVNLFVLKSIFEKWQQESSSLYSPFFDYNIPEVQKALKELMNILSRNISINRENFEPLLTQAVDDTITLLLAPDEYYNRFFQSGEKKKISVKKHIKPI